ncbi:hypothetical protein ACJJTC_013814 [Scirpophaga incertulas]
MLTRTLWMWSNHIHKGVLREEGTRLCEMQRKGRKSKLSEETLGLMKERRENPPVTSSVKRTINREISKHVKAASSADYCQCASKQSYCDLDSASLGTLSISIETIIALLMWSPVSLRS